MNNAQWLNFSFRMTCLFSIVLIVVGVLSQKRHLKEWESTHLSKQGATCLWEGSKGQMVSYNLRSFDGGKNWYAVDINIASNEVKVVGPAEEKFPGLVKHIENWNKLTTHVLDHGPLNLGSTSDMAFLKSIGITIKTNQ